MKEFEHIIKSETGLHMLPATKLTVVAERFKSKITVTKDGTTMNGKSVMGLISLIVRQGEKITICIDGDDEEDAYKTLLDYIEENL